MAEGRESSVLFSLRGLLDIESDRVREELEFEREREAAATAAREEAAAAARAAERTRIVAEERAAALKRLQAEEERQRLDAVRLAAVERARIEAEAAAGIDLLERKQAHEKQLQSLAEHASRRRARFWLAGTNSAWSVLVAAAAAAYFAGLRPSLARERLAHDAVLRAETERAEAGARLARLADSRAKELGFRVAALESELAARRAAPPAAGSSSPAVALRPPTGVAPPPSPVGCRRDTGDPLDFSLCP